MRWTRLQVAAMSAEPDRSSAAMSLAYDAVVPIVLVPIAFMAGLPMEIIIVGVQFRPIR
jgi:hypothetical protein